jgi:hypothetical protein
LWVLEADFSNSYPVFPNYANGTFHLHKDLTNLMDGFMRTYGNGSWFGKQLHRKMGVPYTITFFQKMGPPIFVKNGIHRQDLASIFYRYSQILQLV